MREGDAVNGPRFVEVPADRLLGTLRGIAEKVTAKGGRVVEGVQGREVVVDVVPPGGRAMVRVYTSLASGADTARGCGEDAVRLVVGVLGERGFRPMAEAEKILRTAPRAAADRPGVFLARLTERLRDAYRQAATVPACPTCGRAMVRRESAGGPFYGCSGFPVCRGTRPLGAPASPSVARAAR